MAAVVRFLLPLLLPALAYLSCSERQRRWELSFLYPPAPICRVVAALALLCVALAWACGDPSISKDISYVILTLLLALSAWQTCRDVQAYAQMLGFLASFAVAFLVYSACAGSEHVLLAPVVVLLLLELVIAVQVVDRSYS
jgi:hypothetical protein